MELGRLLINIANIISGGIVCFLASYDYESFVYDLWKREGVIEKLEVRKKVRWRCYLISLKLQWYNLKSLPRIKMIIKSPPN